METADDPTLYQVVMNQEQQYSLWPADRELALGWQAVGKSGTKAECLAYVEQLWTATRPAAARKLIEEGDA